MNFRYNAAERLGKKIYRVFDPAPHTPAVFEKPKNICDDTLFYDPKKLRAFYSRALDILQKERPGDFGDYLEFGVFNGGSIGTLYLLCKERGLTFRKFFGFDAFQGFSPESRKEDGGAWLPGFYACSFEETQECLRQRGVDPDAITWIKGWLNETLTPSLAAEQGIINPGIVFVDCDIYGPSKAALAFVAPLIKKPVIISMDDWRLNDLDLKGMGEYQAFNEFLEANPRLIAKEIPAYSRESRCFVVRPQ